MVGIQNIVNQPLECQHITKLLLLVFHYVTLFIKMSRILQGKKEGLYCMVRLS